MHGHHSAIFSNVWLAPFHTLHPSGSSIKGKSAHESYQKRVYVVVGLEIPYAIDMHISMIWHASLEQRYFISKRNWRCYNGYSGLTVHHQYFAY